MSTRSKRIRLISGDDLPPLRNNEKNINIADRELIIYDQRVEKKFVIDINSKGYYIVDGYSDNYLSMYGKQIKDLKESILKSDTPAIFNSVEEKVDRRGDIAAKAVFNFNDRLLQNIGKISISENGESTEIDDFFQANFK